MSSQDVIMYSLTAIGAIFLLIAILITIGLSNNQAESQDNQELYRKG